MAQKTYINGVFIREHIFPSGDSQLQISIPQDKLGAVFDQLDAACKGGWCKLVVNKNREPIVSKTTGKVIATHSLAVDNYEPKSGAAAPATRHSGNRFGDGGATPPATAAAAPPARRPKHDDNTDSVPF